MYAALTSGLEASRRAHVTLGHLQTAVPTCVLRVSERKRCRLVPPSCRGAHANNPKPSYLDPVAIGDQVGRGGDGEGLGLLGDGCHARGGLRSSLHMAEFIARARMASLPPIGAMIRAHLDAGMAERHGQAVVRRCSNWAGHRQHGGRQWDRRDPSAEELVASLTGVGARRRGKALSVLHGSKMQQHVTLSFRAIQVQLAPNAPNTRPDNCDAAPQH